MRISTLLITSVVTVCAVLHTAPSEACINGVELRVDDGKRLVARADKALQRGRHKDAIRAADMALRRSGPARVHQRAALIRALAVIRSDGRHALRTDAGKLKGRAAVAEATRILAGETKIPGSGEPRWKAALAEGLEATGQTDEALAILEDLAGRDLLPDARAFAALARLRAESGNAPGANTAAERCRQMGGKGLCPVPRS